MFRIFLILIFTFSISISNAAIVKGKIYTQTDTIETNLSVAIHGFTNKPIFRKQQDGFKYLDSTKTYKKLLPTDAIKVDFHYDGKDYIMCSVRVSGSMSSIQSNGGKIFLYLYADGPLKHYKYWGGGKNLPSPVQIRGEFSTTSKEYKKGFDVFQYKDENIFLVPYLNNSLFNSQDRFHEETAIYMDDICPEAAAYIREKRFNANNIDELAKYVNRTCLSE